MRLLLIAVSTGTLFAAGCVRVSSNTIFARDIADVAPQFKSLSPETAIGFAPTPGLDRILSARELIAIARQQGLEIEPGASMPSICVERAVHPIDVHELTQALTAALGVPDAHLTILDFSKQPVPEGRLEFSLSGLSKPPEATPAAPVIWRGRFVYEGQRSLSFWAKISLTVERPALVASEPIASGAILRAEQLGIRTTTQFPFAARPLDSIPQAAGKTARRTIPAGQLIVASALADSEDVARGETVRVQVVDGLALLTLDAVAESSGCKGDPVMLRNPASGRTFRGIVEGRGKAIVRPASGDQS